MKKKVIIFLTLAVCLLALTVGIIISADDSDKITVDIKTLNDGETEIFVDEKSVGYAPMAVETEKTSTITLKNESDGFLFYTDGEYRTVSENGEFSFVANTYNEITVFNKNTDADSLFVIYRNTDDAKQVIHAEKFYYVDEITLTDKQPSSFGKIFKNWDKSAEDIKALFGEKTVIVTPIYDTTGETVKITVSGGTVNGKTSDEVVKGSKITLLADTPEAGKKLNHLTNSQGKHFSFDSEVTLTATVDETYTFNFIGEASALSVQVPKVFLNFSKDNATGKTEIISNRIVPDGYTDVVSGLLYAVDYDGMDSMIIETVDGKNLRYLEHASGDESTVFVNKINFENYAFVRPFIKYTKVTDSGEELKISYGDITTLTKDALAVNYYIDDISSFRWEEDTKYFTYQRTYDFDRKILNYDAENYTLTDNNGGETLAKKQCFVYLYTVYDLYKEDAENIKKVTVYNGTVDGEVTAKVEYGTTVHIEAGEQEGKVFAYFEDINGKKITNKSSFDTTIYDDSEFVAVFFGAEETKKYLPSITLGFDRDASGNVMIVSFVDAKGSIYGDVHSGVIFTNDETKKDLLTKENVDGTDIFDLENAVTDKNGFLTVNTGLTGNVYAKSYITLGNNVFYSASITVSDGQEIVPIIYPFVDNVTATSADITVYKYISDRLNYKTGGLLFIKDYTSNIKHYLDNYTLTKGALNKVFFEDKSQTPFTYTINYNSFADFKIFVDYTDKVYYSPSATRVPSETSAPEQRIDSEMSLSFFRNAETGKVDVIYNRFLFDGNSTVKTGVIYIKDSFDFDKLNLESVDGETVFKVAETTENQSKCGVVQIDYDFFAYVCGYIEQDGVVRYTDITLLDGNFMAESYYLDNISVAEMPTGENLVAYARTAKNENWLTFDIQSGEYTYANELDADNTHVSVYFKTVSKVYDTKADLDADLANIEPLSVVGVKRYYADKKGSSVVFKVNSDKTLQVIPFECGTKKVITPEMYGAKGDGIASDSSALNSVFSASADIIDMQSEQYKQTVRLNLQGKNNFILNGNFARIFNSYSSMNNDDMRVMNSTNVIIRCLYMDCTELQGNMLSGGGDHIQLRVCADSKERACRYVTLNNILLIARPNPEDTGRRVGSFWATDSDDLNFINSVVVNRSKSVLHSAGVWFSASAEKVENGVVVKEATTVRNFVVAYNYIEKSSHDEVLAFFIGNVENCNIFENTLYTHNEPSGDSGSAHMVGFGVADCFTVSSNVIFRNNTLDGVGRRDMFMFSAVDNIKIFDNKITYRNNSADDIVGKGIFRYPGTAMLSEDREVPQTNIEIYNNDISVISTANMYIDSKGRNKGYNIEGLFCDLGDGYYIHDNYIRVDGYLNAIMNNTNMGATFENNTFDLVRAPKMKQTLDNSNTIIIAGVQQ